MDALDLARWQFGVTTVYNFLFVPLTIGLVFLVAGLQTAWHRTGNVHHHRVEQIDHADAVVRLPGAPACTA